MRRGYVCCSSKTPNYKWTNRGAGARLHLKVASHEQRRKYNSSKRASWGSIMAAAIYHSSSLFWGLPQGFLKLGCLPDPWAEMSHYQNHLASYCKNRLSKFQFCRHGELLCKHPHNRQSQPSKSTSRRTEFSQLHKYTQSKKHWQAFSMKAKTARHC